MVSKLNRAIVFVASGMLCAIVIAVIPMRVSAAANVVAEYSFDEGTGTTVTDASGTGNNGTVSGAVWSSSGKNAKALSFDGVNDWVTINDSSSLDLTNAMTMEAWVNPSTLSGWRSIILKEQPGNLVYALYANTDSNRPSVEAVIGGNTDTRGTSQISLNSWTHVAATYDGSTLRFYINGTQVSSRSVSGTIAVSGNVLRIGGNNIWGEYFKGLIDDVRIYNRALSVSEIQTDMNTPVGSSTTPAPTSTPSTPTATPTATSTPTPSPTLTPTPISGGVGQWGSIMNWPFVAVHATLLHTGTVLIWDGWEVPAYPRLWDPSANTFTSVNSRSGLFCSGHATMADGRLLVDGGHSASVVGIKDTNIFNTSNNTWSNAADMNYARWYPSTTMLADGRLVTISGQITTGDYADIPEVYNPTNNTWTALSSISTSYIQDEDYPLTFLIPNGNVFAIGQISGRTGSLNVSAPSWSTMPTAPVQFGTAAMYRPGKVIISGGGPGGGNAEKKTAVIDLTAGTPTWRTTASMAYPRYLHNLTVLPDGKVLAVGGATTVDKGALTGSLPAELWDPATETWSTMAAMSDPRMYHSISMVMPDGRVLSAGGGRFGMANNYFTAQYYSPPYLQQGTRPTISNAPTSTGYNASMTIQTPDANTISKVSLIALGSVTHSLDMNQHYVELSFTKGSGQLTVTSPSGPTIAPPGYYMLFILNGNGVPSVAKIIQMAQSPSPTSTPTYTPTPGGPSPTSTPSSTPTPTPNQNALVMALGFNEGSGTTVGDSSGNGNAGSITGATWVSGGKYGKALSFNGSGNVVDINDSNSLDITNAITIEAWVNPSTLSDWRSIVLKERPSNLVYSLYASTDTNNPSAEIVTSSNFDSRGPSQLSLNTWTHLAMTYDGTTLRLYVNGTRVSSRAVTGAMVTSSNPLKIGGNTIWGEYFNGLIDEVRIYNRALSPSEIQTDMNTGI